MHKQVHRILVIAASTLIASFALADHDPAHERHELMEGVKEAAKPLGGMLQGKVEFDQEIAMASLAVMADAAAKIGNLVPEGSEGGEAAPAIWEDPDGFTAAIEKFRAATDGAIQASPSTLEEAKPVVGPVFNACKNCHDSYRIEEE